MVIQQDPEHRLADVESTGLDYALRKRLSRARLFGFEPEDIRVGRFSILEKVGQGSMGSVYRAHDNELGRVVAVKLLSSERAGGRSESLIHEARLLAQLTHPNVVQVFEVGVHENETFVAMELVQGVSLSEWSRRTPKPTWKECLSVYTQAAEGLAAAHEKGIAHRDFKPENIAIDSSGRVLVLDFGLATQRRQSMSSLGSQMVALSTSHQGLVGTPAYMAPEQLLGCSAGEKTDQFSFCVCLYEGIFGTRPFIGETISDLHENMLAGAPKMSSIDCVVPARLARVLSRGLSYRPEDRWASLEDVVRELHVLSRPRRWIWPSIGTVMAIGVFALGLSKYEEVSSRCGGSPEQLVGVWDADTRNEFQRSLYSKDLTEESREWLRLAGEGVDAYAATWIEQHEEICESTNIREEQSMSLMNARVQCLYRLRQELSAVTKAMSNANVGIAEHAGELVSSLPSLEQCRSREILRDLSRQGAEGLTILHSVVYAELAEAKVARYSGDFRVARAKISRCRALTAYMEGDLVQADVAIEEAAFLRTVGDLSGSEQSLHSALRVAVSHGSERHIFLAASGLMTMVGVVRHRFSDLGFALTRPSIVA